MRNELNNQMLPLRNQSGSSVPGATRTEQGSHRYAAHRLSVAQLPFGLQRSLATFFKMF